MQPKNQLWATHSQELPLSKLHPLHRSNLSRLLAGTEPKLGQPKAH